MKIKQMPESQRPDERAIASGTGSLSDAELIAVILRTGTVGKSSLEIANEILSIDRGKEGIGNLTVLTYTDLLEIRGLGKVKALQIACVCELAARISSNRSERNITIDSPEKAADYFMESTRHLDHEVVYILLTDIKNRLIRNVMAACGSIDSASVSPREIIKTALAYNAYGFVLVHNHPSGDTEPSCEDIKFCRQLKEAASFMNIRFNDSIIIGDRTYLSMLEKGLF